MAKYDPLRALLEYLPADQAVNLMISQIDELVGGLPPDAVNQRFWANTRGHPQSRSWLDAGRRAEPDLPRSVTFLPIGTGPGAGGGLARVQSAKTLLDGVATLQAVIKDAGYASIAHAVARHSVFLSPDTVRLTRGEPVFPIVRDPAHRGEWGELSDGRRVMYDDNTTPKDLFRWCARAGLGRDTQLNHLWGSSGGAISTFSTYTAAWNLVLTPAFLAKTTDGRNHPAVLGALRYRAFELYGYPSGNEHPARPADYETFEWRDPLDPVGNLEELLRARLRAAPKKRAAVAAREIGWLFSGWDPDPRV